MNKISARSLWPLFFALLFAVPALGSAAEPADDGAAEEAVETEVAPVEEGGGGGLVAPVETVSAPATANGFDLSVRGYLRSSFTYIDHDESESDFIGRNDGFGMANIRIGVEGSRDRASFVVSLDGAVALADSGNTASGQVAVRVADAYAGYEVVPGVLSIEFGQQRAPFDGESLLSNAELPFVQLSVWNRGVRGVEGWNVDGLGVPREVGVTLRGDMVEVAGPLALSYAVAVTNGTSAYRMMNENQAVAAYGRVELHVDEFLTIGGAGYHNLRTYGMLPDMLDERHVGFAGDIVARMAGAWLRADFVQRDVEYPDVEIESARTSRGFGASVGYKTPFGLEPAYRFAFYDPAAKFSNVSPALAAQLEASEVTHHTIGLTFAPEGQPLAVQANYTLSLENPAREIRNDRFELLGRLVF